MKSISFFLLFFFFSALHLSAQNSYWQTAAGPYGGNVSVTPTFNNKVYAGFNSGATLRSTDYGQHWALIDVPPVDPESYFENTMIGYSGNFYSIVLKQEGFQWVRRLYRSQNEGATWELRNESLQLSELWESPSGVLMGFLLLVISR